MSLESAVEGVLIFWSDRICNRIRSRWDSLGIPGKSEADFYPLSIVQGIVASRISGWGQRAYIAEFGSGSLMDKNNPYLEKYLQSPEFNQWRLHSSRMPIMGRSAGEYQDLDGRTEVSTGKMQGLDLERDGKPQWQPHEPMHNMEQEIDAALPEIMESITQAITDEFYLITIDKWR
jgi:hypothetical protein